MKPWRKPPCRTGKAAYRTRGDANRAITTIVAGNAQAVAPLPEEPIRAFRCACGAWHLSSREYRPPMHPKARARTDRTRRARRNRRRPRVSQPRGLRHLKVAPDTIAAPVSGAPPAVTFAPTDPITPARLAHWESAAAERDRQNAEARLGPALPRRAA